MNINFQIITSITMGGAENVSISICEYMIENNSTSKPIIFEIHRSGSSYAIEKKKALKEKGIEYHTLGLKNKYLSLIIAPFKLYRYIRKYKPAVIHSHTDLPDFVLAMAKSFMPKSNLKIVRTIHNTELWPTHSFLGKTTENKFIDDTIIAVSKSALSAYRNLRKKYSLKESINQEIIYNGIKQPIHSYHPFQIDPLKINIAFGGRLELQKGVDVLSKVIEQLPSLMKKRFLFHIIGNGSLKEKVTELSKKNNHCIYYGSIPDLSNKLFPFDYIIMPSRFEGFGLISLEASLSGVPVIATKVPGLCETLPANWPLFINELTVTEIIELLIKINNNAYNREELKQLARSYTAEKFSFNKMGKEYIKHFQSN